MKSELRAAERALAVWLAARSGAGEHPTPARIARVREKLAEPMLCLVLAEREAGVVGMALAEKFRAGGGEGTPVPGWGHVSMVFVEPDAQRRGVGRELVDRLVAESGWTTLSLWTRQSNLRAQRLYRDRGFLPTGDHGRTSAGEPTQRWVRPGRVVDVARPDTRRAR